MTRTKHLQKGQVLVMIRCGQHLPKVVQGSKKGLGSLRPVGAPVALTETLTSTVTRSVAARCDRFLQWVHKAKLASTYNFYFYQKNSPIRGKESGGMHYGKTTNQQRS